MVLPAACFYGLASPADEQHKAVYVVQALMTMPLRLEVFGCCAGVRTIAFAPDGSCLLAAAQDGLAAWAWEPITQLDTVEVPWAKVVSKLRLGLEPEVCIGLLFLLWNTARLCPTGKLSLSAM